MYHKNDFNTVSVGSLSLNFVMTDGMLLEVTEKSAVWEVKIFLQCMITIC